LIATIWRAVDNVLNFILKVMYLKIIINLFFEVANANIRFQMVMAEAVSGSKIKTSESSRITQKK